MTSFPLKIVTLDGLFYDGEAEEIIVRTTMGDMGVLAGHLNCVAPLGMGRATIVINGQKRYASCIGGIIFVLGGEVKLVPTTFEWAEDIDVARSEQVAELMSKTDMNKLRPYFIQPQYSDEELREELRRLMPEATEEEIEMEINKE